MKPKAEAKIHYERSGGWYRGEIYLNGSLKEKTANVRNRKVAIMLLNRRIERFNTMHHTIRSDDRPKIKLDLYKE